jgi:hypothetical protein
MCNGSEAEEKEEQQRLKRQTCRTNFPTPMVKSTERWRGGSSNFG